MSKKIKVLTIGDHPLSPSGVGTQSKYFIEALLKSGKFEVISIGGAIKHQDYRPIVVEPWDKEWRILPIDGYGNPEIIRSLLRNEKVDMMWIMTDPRFYEWLWQFDNEIRSLVPLVYYHVWDNYPYPMYNNKFYESNDHIACISKLTYDVVKNVAPNVSSSYLPHAVDANVFVSHTEEQRKKLREQTLPPELQDRFIVFWNNRNARRKQSGSLVWWWKEWLDERGLHDKATLLMHIDPKDVHGQDLVHMVDHLDMNEGQVVFSTEKVPLEAMSTFYNVADVTINISDAEGFGLATLESLSCGTPIIATMTGGLQEQVVGEDTYGIPLFPSSKAIIGSQQVPYIYEDRLSRDHVLSALSNMYDIGQTERRKMGAAGRQHVLKNYNFNDFNRNWVDLMLEIYEKHGSWNNRSEYSSIIFKEIA